ncbi:MAG: hypothetical protein R3D46_00655 [Defluviimonas denitrificans]
MRISDLRSPGVADSVKAKMADIGFGGHEGHRHLVADLAAAQFGVEDEEEFIGRAEAGRALHRADDDRAGVLAEGLESCIGLKRMIDMADGLRMPAMRTPAPRSRQKPVPARSR